MALVLKERGTTQSVYSAKEIQIFEGVLDLLKEGHPLHGLKVSDIAARAGMGKSTAYEHFESKEDILREALQYHVEKAFSTLTAVVVEEHTLEGMLTGLMDQILRLIESRLSIILLMVFSLGSGELRPGAPLSRRMMQVQESFSADIHRRILEQGREEGRIAEDLSDAEARLLLHGLYTAFMKEAAHLRLGADCTAPLPDPEGAQEPEVAALKARTLRMLQKALG